MRFLKKTGHSTIGQDAVFYKDFELQATQNTLQHTDKIKAVLTRENAVIAALHAPLSALPNNAGNYISLCEVLHDNDSYEAFRSTCRLAEELCQQNRIMVVIHTGCAYGCGANYDRLCGRATCSLALSNEHAEKLHALLREYPHVDIVLENITPYLGENRERGYNSGHGYECFDYAKHCNAAMRELDRQKSALPADDNDNTVQVGKHRFGVAVDICHIIATSHIIERDRYAPLEAVKSFLDNRKEDKALIKLLHLSDYNKDDNSHGEVFSEAFANELCSWLCGEYFTDPLIPATLELRNSDDVQLGHSAFMNTVIRFSIMHTKLKGRIDDSLYDFLGQLYRLYSTEDTHDPSLFTVAKAVRRFILDNTLANERGRKLFGFTNDLQKLSMSLLRIRAYIMYVRACTIAKNVGSRLERIG